jgi:hypothetical protein
MMKVILICFALLFIEGNFNLEVEVEGLNGTKGTVFIGLFDSSKDFPIFGKQLKGVVVKIEGKKVLYQLNSIKTYLGHPLKSMGFQTMPVKYSLHLAFKMQVLC